jgi:hypothetical protein
MSTTGRSFCMLRRVRRRRLRPLRRPLLPAPGDCTRRRRLVRLWSLCWMRGCRLAGGKRRNGRGRRLLRGRSGR